MAGSATTLDSLTESISISTAIITKFLKCNGHPQPSFDTAGPKIFPPDAPKEVNEARIDLMMKARDLQLLASWPLDGIMTLSGEGLHFVYQHFISHFYIADHVPPTESISYIDLCKKLNLPIQKTIRILRYAMVDHIFREPEVGYIAHTSYSLALRKDGHGIPVASAFFINAVENHIEAVPKYVECIEKYGDEIETGENAPGTLGYGIPIMEYLNQHPEKLKILSDCMREVSKAPLFDVNHLIKGYDWESIVGDGVVVDVGGGEGPITKALATAYPRMHCIVQDRSHAVQKGQVECSPEIANRMTWQAHDFFTPNPIKNAEVYFMRMIMHDWPDHSAAQILQNIKVSMGERSRIIVNDAVTPGVGQAENAFMEQFYRRMDILMMTMNGIERTREQWEDLVESVGGLRISRIVKTGGLHEVIEIVKV